MKIKHIDSSDFEVEVFNSSVPVLVDFYADWCSPCKKMGPILQSFANSNPGIKVCKVNVDNSPELVQKFDIVSIPYFIAVKDGNVIAGEVGGHDEEELLAMFNK